MIKNKRKILAIILISIMCLFFIIVCSKWMNKTTEIFVVENGSLESEEHVEGYIIRDEKVLEGENFKNGMVQIKTEGERCAKGDAVFRYYSSSESELNNQIADIDKKINQALEENGTRILDADVISLDNKIQLILNNMNGINDIEKQKEYMKEIGTYISKKSEIAGEKSPAGSYLKDLINQRNSLKKQLEENSEIVKTDMSGIISYRVDQNEEVLGVNDLNYLNCELLKNLNIELGKTIPQNNEYGKIINNFYCYIACVMDSEKSMEAKVGDKVLIKLPNSEETVSTIEFIKDDGNKRIIVFKIKENVESLIDYRKILVEVVWWKYSGLKVSNSAIVDENDLSYIYKNKTGYTEKTLVKVLRQNDTFSIVTNYTKEELLNLGFKEDEISDMPQIKMYDEVIISK